MADPAGSSGSRSTPIVEIDAALRHLARLNPAVDQVAGIRIDRDAMVREWRELLPFLKAIPFGPDPAAGYHFGFENGFYSWGDASVLHAMLRLRRPARLIEVGCGFSSACSYDTVRQYLDGRCALTFIDPDLARLRGLIGDIANATLHECTVQDAPLRTFTDLWAGDFLFVDSSHVVKTGSDVCYLLFEVLPRLASGVLVHFHDIFWPFEYPAAWLHEKGSSWNEIYALRAYLTNNDAWRIVMFNDYFGRFERPLIEATYPAFLRNPGGALWLQKR